MWIFDEMEYYATMRVERRRMKDIREYVGTKDCIVGKIVYKKVNSSPDNMPYR